LSLRAGSKAVADRVRTRTANGFRSQNIHTESRSLRQLRKSFTIDVAEIGMESGFYPMTTSQS